MRRFLPTLTALHAFDAAVRYQNFSRAAEDMGITPSGISRQIRNLEEFLGLTLFERAGPRIVLTEAGRSYYDEISHLLDRIEEASIDAVRGRSTRGLLHIAVPATLGLRWATPLLGQFLKAHPDFLFEVSTCGSTEMPTASDIDVAILRGAGNWADWRTDALVAEELVVVGAPAILPPTGFAAAGALGQHVLLQNASRPSLWLHWLRSAGIEHQGIIVGPRFDLTESIIQAALHGMGLAVVPEILVRRELAAGSLKLAYPQRCSSGEAWYLCIREGHQSRKPVQVLRQWLLAAVRRAGQGARASQK